MKLDPAYFDSNYLLQPHGENGILFTCEFCILQANLHDSSSVMMHHIFDKAANSCLKDNRFEAVKDEPWSHDNHTGIVCASKAVGHTIHTKYFYEGWNRRVHPRDVIFYLYLKGGIVGLLAWFFLWIPSISMILTCLQTYKTRNNEKMIKTDGKLLAWCRLSVVNMPITTYLCTLALKMNKNFGSWKNCFSIYFKDKNHPLNQYTESQYNPRIRYVRK